jgi:hypothetical protein
MMVLERMSLGRMQPGWGLGVSGRETWSWTDWRLYLVVGERSVLDGVPLVVPVS